MDEEKYKIILRHDNSTNWTLNNPILYLGEYGVEDDTHRVKRGDGVTPWVELQYETFGIDISVEEELADRFVEKKDGKGLSTNDFTTEYKLKLEGLHNYDDSEIKAQEETNARNITIVNNKVDAIHIPEYTLILTETTQGFAKTYALTKDNVIVGATINIPKDLVIESGEVKVVEEPDIPYEGAEVGDKYIDLTLANSDDQHIYIPVKDLVDVYSGSVSININENNEISLIVDENNSNGLEVGENGLKLNLATATEDNVEGTAGAMSAEDKTKLDSLEVITNTSDLTNDGDGQSAFATEDYVNTHGPTFKTYPEGFDTTHTTQDFINSILALNLPSGMAYLGGVRLTDLPFNGNAEIEVYIYPNNVIYCILRSANISPYEWECNSHTYRGWEPIGKAYADTNFLSKTNTTSYTPSANYHPATKKYVDDTIAASITNVLNGSY